MGKIWQVLESSTLGFAIGDAMGVPVEFVSRKELLKKPVTKMLGHGSHDVPPGTWSDDTSMVLATMASLVHKKGFDPNDLADFFCKWLNEAAFTATDEIFDIGTTTKYALLRYYHNDVDATTCGATGRNENGNGSLMRMLPLALYSYIKKVDVLKLVTEASSITHAHEISILGCYLYVCYVHFLLETNQPDQAFLLLQKISLSLFSKEARDAYHRLLSPDFLKLELEDISSTGYVVDTLEATIWVFHHTTDFKSAIIGAINLGDDTDTIGALVGSLAGIYYGSRSFPPAWKKALLRKEKILDLCYELEHLLTD